MAMTLEDLPRIDVRQVVGSSRISQAIQVVATPCNYGGVRYWLKCPGCGSRARFLYRHGHEHICRKCLGLPYRTQNMNVWSRLWKRKDAILRSLQWENEAGFMKPAGMHEGTFQKLLAKLRSIDDKLNRATGEALMGLNRKLGLIRK